MAGRTNKAIFSSCTFFTIDGVLNLSEGPCLHCEIRRHSVRIFLNQKKQYKQNGIVDRPGGIRRCRNDIHVPPSIQAKKEECNIVSKCRPLYLTCVTKPANFLGGFFFRFRVCPKNFWTHYRRYQRQQQGIETCYYLLCRGGFRVISTSYVYLPNFPMGGVAVHRSRVNNLSPFSRPTSSKVSQTDCYLKQKVTGSSKCSIVKKTT